MADTPPAMPRTLEQRLALYSAVVVTLGAVLGIVAWFPTFAGKQQELSAFALLTFRPSCWAEWERSTDSSAVQPFLSACSSEGCWASGSAYARFG